MLYKSIDLGSTIHMQKDHEIQLYISSSVQIAQLNDSPCLEELSIEKLRRQDVWASWGSNSTIQINISVKIQTSLATKVSIPGTLRTISELLTLPSVWSVYGLDATQDGKLHLNETNTLNITLQARPTRDQATSCELNKIPTSLSALLDGNPHIQPPAEIPTIFVRDISIQLVFSNGSSSPILLPEGGDNCNGPLNVLLSDSDGWESLDDSTPFSSQESSSTRFSGNSNYGSSTHKSPVSGSHNISPIRSIISLLNAGLVNLLNIASPDTGSIQSMPSNGHQVSLTELSPVIFSPGYNIAMFQRLSFMPLVIKGMVSIIRSMDSRGCESTTSKICDIYRLKSCTAGFRTVPVSSDIRDMLRYILWVQTKNSLCPANKKAKISHLFATAASKQQEILGCPTNNLRKADPMDALVAISGCPDSDWHIFEDEEEDDILLSDEAYSEEQDEWNNPPTLTESVIDNDGSRFITTPEIARLMLDQDGVLSSSPCLLAEVDIHPILERPGEEPDCNTGVPMVPRAGNDPTMEILQSSSPIILPLSASQGSPCNDDIDTGEELDTLPRLDSSDIEMLLL
ncbi:hypothetical protein H112_01213 [Trichophyton rubrum D6]|uniref:Uncharacterized protein n=2 Tax=Trichophyton rubrum TaxID=5551 RepID=F2SYH2_TRIRC|nr:uncharacterized protein TERG_07627 [Trichophyton rubrum CBS 118892]EZF26666.1 hypothetical protein H100_01206 [Trichophyton rubrum MR850]EZF45772.1 hypothetical protein H102_01203 [Trichophyton rubrum CBS 100081]EZF56346.1 hypothetical protein H103_01210 [Trichophyton rubrum CBS 288.86]EZF66929.1 hypothetical protein H104_01196 [Trichophyton rubrum CBS 289.86]EZF88274.1 hypothetical protein H110_01213 [Trichophyton rubrum MR1448]EZF99109.1 hypothetical protein H113_01213 [Trichophyton rubr